MQFRTREYVVAIGVVLGAMSAPAVAQLPPPPPPPATLWSFLGIPQGYRSFRDGRSNRNGNRPGAERKPPLKAIADPKNLASPDPSIKKAAEVKQAEDLAPQKVKAVKYLASIGCGCYNRDGSITDALLKSMDDCTEEVRLMTVRAISEAAAGEQCANCKQRSCCSEEISNKLYEIAYEKDDTGCFLEPSERVRLSAAEALRTCCPGSDDDFIIEMAPAPTPATGGEQPGIAPPTGGERPGIAPPLPIEPGPGPAIPLQNPPAPILPPGAVPRPPAAGTTPAPRSSRRTASVQRAEPESTAVQSTAAKSTAPQAVSRVNPIVLDAPPQSPHWTADKSRHSVHFVPPARGPFPLDAAVDVEVAPAGAIVRIGASSSAVTNASLTRLPPVDGPAVDSIPSPPLPPVSTQAIPVSTRRSKMPSVLKGNAIAPEAATATEPAKRKPAIPAAAQRTIPGAQFGTGMVTSVRLKDGLAMLEFANDGAVPPGSVVRAYHEYALTGKTAVCDLEVVRGEGGLAAAVARSGSELTALSIGDRVVVLR
jgi:hypothetical protein